jgi:hypothetical protein
MSYSTTDDVKGLFQGISFGSGTKIPSSEVETWIDDADKLIDGYLKGSYSVPVTGAGSLAIVKQISMRLAGHQVERRLTIDSGSSDFDKTRKKDLRAEAMDMLNDIVKKKLVLPDASKSLANGGAQSYASVSTTSERVFNKDDDQW